MLLQPIKGFSIVHKDFNSISRVFSIIGRVFSIVNKVVAPRSNLMGTGALSVGTRCFKAQPISVGAPKYWM